MFSFLLFLVVFSPVFSLCWKMALAKRKRGEPTFHTITRAAAYSTLTLAFTGGIFYGLEKWFGDADYHYPYPRALLWAILVFIVAVVTKAVVVQNRNRHKEDSEQ